MRAKVILPASALALVVLASAYYYRFGPAPTPAQPAAQSADTSSSPPSAQPSPPPRVFALARRDDDVPPPEPDSGADPNAANHQDYVTERRAELGDLGTSNDPASLKTILSELNNQDQRIRTAALDATVQFGSQDAIPALRNEMAWAEDPHEKAAIADAIDFLQLPSADSVTDQSMAH